MSKNVLQFSEDGTKFHFIFADGSESLEITSKAAGFNTIMDLLKKSKISVVEFGEFQKLITQAEKLPWNESTRRPFSGPIGLLLGLSAMSIIGEISESMQALEEEPVEVATFRLCGCGKIHGRIFLKNGGTSLLETKEEAFLTLDAIKKAGHVTDEEFEKVKMEIENSGMS